MYVGMPSTGYIRETEKVTFQYSSPGVVWSERLNYSVSRCFQSRIWSCASLGASEWKRKTSFQYFKIVVSDGKTVYTDRERNTSFHLGLCTLFQTLWLVYNSVSKRTTNHWFLWLSRNIWRNCQLEYSVSDFGCSRFDFVVSLHTELRNVRRVQ